MGKLFDIILIYDKINADFERGSFIWNNKKIEMELMLLET